MTSASLTPLARSSAAQAVDVQQLLDRCLGSVDLAERCLSRFEQKLRADVESIQQCTDRDDIDELARIAHRVKGSAATVAASDLAKSAAALEGYARGASPAEADEVVADFLREVERFFDMVPQLSQVR